MSAADSRIVVLNAGSSSLKFAAYPLAPEAPPLLSGAVDGIGGSAHLTITGADGQPTHEGAVTAADPQPRLPREPLRWMPSSWPLVIDDTQANPHLTAP